VKAEAATQRAEATATKANPTRRDSQLVEEAWARWREHLEHCDGRTPAKPYAPWSKP
jgi:hypothetical protein